jgi:hypothetical protein
MNLLIVIIVVAFIVFLYKRRRIAPHGGLIKNGQLDKMPPVGVDRAEWQKERDDDQIYSMTSNVTNDQGENVLIPMRAQRDQWGGVQGK